MPVVRYEGRTCQGEDASSDYHGLYRPAFTAQFRPMPLQTIEGDDKAETRTRKKAESGRMLNAYQIADDLETRSQRPGLKSTVRGKNGSLADM